MIVEEALLFVRSRFKKFRLLPTVPTVEKLHRLEAH